MANCKYCGEPAGLFRKFHAECAARYAGAMRSIPDMLATAVKEGGDLGMAVANAERDARSARVSDADFKMLCAEAWDIALDTYLADRVIDESEQVRMMQFADVVPGLPQALANRGNAQRFSQGVLLHQLASGIEPTTTHDGDDLSFLLQKSERLLWVFRGVDYIESVSKRRYEGGSQGASFRVMKGVYYRVGASKGRAIDYTDTIRHTAGILAVTSKHAYYHGGKVLRIPLTSVIATDSYSDGVGLQVQRGQSVRHEVFITSDAWFLQNLISLAG